MPRKLIIVGNGLGMAIDPVHFSLNLALEHVWELEGFLNPVQRTLIERCLGRAGAPNGEHELDELHLAVNYCKALNQIGEGREHWLTADGQNFPDITSRYIHKVASRLYNYDGHLPPNFEAPVIDFLKDTKSHVATLNYDKLLYSSFISNDIFGLYNNTTLVDGMIGAGFSAERLERRFQNNFGYYLHLHGSPLFVNRDNRVIKLARDDLTDATEEASEHIVLTHVKHKPAVIAGSHVLSTYWDYLRFALSESDEIILFGYSGLDNHLNLLLRPYLRNIIVRVIEWSGNIGDQPAREQYWLRLLGKEVQVNLLDNITDFADW